MGKASLGIEEQRVKALAAYARGDFDAESGSRADFAPGAALNFVADLATSSLALPASLIGGMFEDKPDPVGKPLAERSALLLLVLTHNLRATDDAMLKNPYREALERLVDAPSAPASYKSPLLTAASLSQGVPISFRALFTSLVALCDQPLGVCLLYTLLQGSNMWREHVLSRVDVDALLLPLLAQLYSVSMLTPDHRYILLITLLLFTQVRGAVARPRRARLHNTPPSLTRILFSPRTPPPLEQDPAFCLTAHQRVKISSSKLSWFRERRLGEISLGSLLLTLLMRTVAVTSGLTTSGASDSYVHTNCFAAAANMSPYTEGLHPYAAHRSLSTLSAMHKKHTKLAAKLRTLPAPVDASSPAEEYARVSGLVEHYDQCIRICCETLLATCAPVSLPRNISLLYALLRDRAAFDSLAADAAFSDAAKPIGDVISHFAEVVRRAEAARALALAKTGSGGADEVAATEKGEVAAAGKVVPWQERDVIEELTAAAKTWVGGDDAAKANASLMETKFLCVWGTHAIFNRGLI